MQYPSPTPQPTPPAHTKRPFWRRYLGPLVGGLVAVCVVCSVIATLLPDPPPESNTALASIVAALSAESVAAASAVMGDVAAPDAPPAAPTDRPEPTLTREPPGVPTDADVYLSIAKTAAGPIAREDAIPDSAWSARTVLPGDISVTMPLPLGRSNDQTVRLGKQMMSQVVNALFVQVPELTQVNVIGTTPLNGEAPAISIVVPRGAAPWGTMTVEAIGELATWQVSPRLEH
jgi:hypothetical protein